jgi:hypothetical protein
MINAFGKLALVLTLGVSAVASMADSAGAASVKRKAMTPGTYSAYSHGYGHHAGNIHIHRTAMTPGGYAAYSHGYGHHGGKVHIHRTAMTPGTYSAYSHHKAVSGR